MEVKSLKINSDELRQQRYIALVDELCRLPAETPWAEFKVNNTDPERIGRTVSALANSARLADKPFGYMAWGIEDGTHSIVGTDFEPSLKKKGNEPLEFWLSKALDPSPMVMFQAVIHPKGRIILLEIPAASTSPVQFMGQARIRVGEATPLLSDFPEREKYLWNKLQPLLWETGVASSFLTSDDVLELLDYPSYFKLTKQRLPDNRVGILARLAEEHIILPDVGDRWNILNLGAALFAHDLGHFERLSRKKCESFSTRGKIKRPLQGSRSLARVMLPASKN